jgi:hypothetical protein
MKSTRKQALRIAQRLGCYGAHQNEDGAWMPCVDAETLASISRGEKPTSLKSYVSELNRKAARVTAGRGKLFATREEAMAESKRNGCSGVRVVLVNGGRMYAACMPRNNGAPENTGLISPRKRDWEPLGGRGVMSIETLPDGGLVSGKNLGRSISRAARSVKPSTIDGDNDGFVTGPTGEDNVPAPPKRGRTAPSRNRPGLRNRLRYNPNLTNIPGERRNDRGFVRDIDDRATGGEFPDPMDDDEDLRDTIRQVDPLPYWLNEELSREKLERDAREAEKYRQEVIARRKREREKEKNQEKKDYDITEIDAKGFVNYVSRSTDPDVYTDPDSARVRARQLGCIGIRSYTARDGKRVYLPCTNGPDYNRVMRLRPDGRPKKKKSDCGCDEKSLAKTPAPKKDRVFGSRKNRVGSAGSLRSAGSISMTPEIVQSLTKKVREHNADVKKKGKDSWSRTNLRALKAVYRRGAGAFSVSHRPGMNRNQWAMGRVNAFLRLLMSGSAKASYTTDNDLLPNGHPWKKKGLSGKSLFIDEKEYFAEELAIGVKSIGDRKFVARRFIAFPVSEGCEE